MTTNKHQPPAPPERVWLEFLGGNVRGVSVYVPEWHDNTPITHRLERIKQNGFPYARVHEVDEGRVRDGSACLHETCTRPLDCRYYCMERHSRLCVEPRNRIGLARTEAGKCEHGVLWSMECLSCGHSDFEAAPASSSERRCGECGHGEGVGADGFCQHFEVASRNAGSRCLCKCVFPATGAGEGEMPCEVPGCVVCAANGSTTAEVAAANEIVDLLKPGRSQREKRVYAEAVAAVISHYARIETTLPANSETHERKSP